MYRLHFITFKDDESAMDELEMMECDRSSNNKILKLQTLTLINSLFP